MSLEAEGGNMLSSECKFSELYYFKSVFNPLSKNKAQDNFLEFLKFLPICPHLNPNASNGMTNPQCQIFLPDCMGRGVVVWR